jgi:hypothetical protein
MGMLQHLEHGIRMDPTTVTLRVSQEEGGKREDQDGMAGVRGEPFTRAENEEMETK